MTSSPITTNAARPRNPRSRGKVLGATALVLATATGSALATGSSANGAAAPTCRPGSVRAQTLPWFPLTRTRGDREFGGHGPAVTVSAERMVTAARDAVVVQVKMRAEETRSDWTTGTGTRTFTIYRAPRGCKIVDNLRYGSFDSNGYLAHTNHRPHALAAGNQDADPRKFSRQSFVSGYTVYDDHVGLDLSGYTGVRVGVRAFPIPLRAG